MIREVLEEYTVPFIIILVVAALVLVFYFMLYPQSQSNLNQIAILTRSLLRVG